MVPAPAYYLVADHRYRQARLRSSIRHRFRIATRRLAPRPLPDFLIIGAQRSGTTALHHLLADHAGIRAPVRKEINFFTHNFHRGIGWYRAHFPISLLRGERSWLTFESTPYYLYYPLAARRAHTILPHGRLIAILRNPVDRAFSQYRLNVLKGRESRSFMDAIRAEEQQQKAATERITEHRTVEDHIHDYYSYLSRGLYVDQLQHWLDFYGAERLLVLCFEEFRANATGELRRVVDFLGLARGDQLVVKNRGFEATRNQAIPYSSRSLLVDYFAPSNERLFQVVGRTFPWD